MYVVYMSLTYIIDFDSTLVSVESLDELAHIGMARLPHADDLLEQFTDLTNRAMDGTLPFDKALRQRITLLNVTRTDIKQLIEELQGTITDSVLANKEWFLENADRIYIVSGGFEDYIVPIVKELGIAASHVFANRFVYDKDDVVIGFDASSHLSKAKGKVAQVAELELLRPIVMIGDGMTDYEVRAGGEADEFWAFTQHVTRPAVVERADRILTNFEEIEELTLLVDLEFLHEDLDRDLSVSHI